MDDYTTPKAPTFCGGPMDGLAIAPHELAYGVIAFDMRNGRQAVYERVDDGFVYERTLADDEFYEATEGIPATDIDFEF